MTQAQHKVLVVEDDPLVRKAVARMLSSGDFSVLLAGDAKQAQAELGQEAVDLILLDWVLPEMSGIELLRWLKSSPELSAIPVVMMTSKSKQSEVLKGFELGVDDYVRKPFSSRELLARVRAVLRRTSPAGQSDVLEAGDLRLEIESRTLFVKNEPVDLTPIGYGLLLFFLRSPERVHARDDLRRAVWGADVHVAPRTIDVHIAALRQALRPWGHDKLLQTRHGAGYLFRLPKTDPEDPPASSE